MSDPRLILIWSGARWLIGRDVLSTDGVGILSPAFEYVGGLTANSQIPGSISVRHGVVPIDGLITLKSVPQHGVIIPLTDLDASEQKDIESAFARCEEMVAAVRAEMGGIATSVAPRIIVPGGIRA